MEVGVRRADDSGRDGGWRVKVVRTRCSRCGPVWLPEQVKLHNERCARDGERAYGKGVEWQDAYVRMLRYERARMEGTRRRVG